MVAEELLYLLVTVQLLSATGALAPGPLFITNLIYGSFGGWKTGFQMALGHMLVEFPLYLAIGLGLISIIHMANIKIYLGITGGIVMIAFGILQFISLRKRRNYVPDTNIAFRKHSPLFMGIILSAFNPFFILWWVFIGSTFIYSTVNILSYYGLPLIYMSHVWMDFVWLTFTAHAAFLGKNLLKEKFYNLFVTVLSLLLVVFGVHFIFKSLWGISILPL